VEAMVLPNPVSVRGVTSAPIIVDDEEDDVVVSSPRSFAQVRHRLAHLFFCCDPICVQVLLNCAVEVAMSSSFFQFLPRVEFLLASEIGNARWLNSCGLR